MKALILTILALCSTAALAAFSSADGKPTNGNNMPSKVNSTNPKETVTPTSGMKKSAPQKSDQPTSMPSSSPMSNATVAR